MEKFVGVYTTPFHSVGKSYFHYRTSINCKNVLEYTHDNNTFIMLLTKIFIELYVTNVYIVAMIQIDEYLNTNFALSKGTVSLGYMFLSEIGSRFNKQDKPVL